MQYIIDIIHNNVNLYALDDEIDLSSWHFQVTKDIHTIANKLSDILNTLPLNLFAFHRFLKDLNTPSQ